MSQDVYARVLDAYARQSWAIDHGDAQGWADSFTPDGTFTSPSYPRDYCGTTELVGFAEDFARSAKQDDVVRRHVVSNVLVDNRGDRGADARCTLQIVEQPTGGPPRIVRVVDVHDEWVLAGPAKVRHRRVNQGENQ